tara:strand:- start:223 stop:513 length:291 start_codon:yes stop_codon:yes gene_type:complete
VYAATTASTGRRFARRHYELIKIDQKASAHARFAILRSDFSDFFTEKASERLLVFFSARHFPLARTALRTVRALLPKSPSWLIDSRETLTSDGFWQ